MNFKDIAVPDIYKQESADFRFFLDLVAKCLTEIKYNTENIFDLYDPLKCPSKLLWMLGESMGFKYDDRLPVAFNRLVLMYFMSMIRYKGSKDGVTLAAELNLAQFNILDYGKSDDILYERLEDTSIPVNSAYVTPHVNEGYIDVVYFTDTLPVDACIEYVRPLGMYVFQTAGVRFDARTKISIDARLTNSTDLNMSVGPTHVGHYSREDYARLQKMTNESERKVNTQHTRRGVYNRNKDYEKTPDATINPGYRAMQSLQLSNNDHVVKALIEPYFSVGYGPDDVSVMYPDDYLTPVGVDRPLGRPQRPDWMAWNLRYDRQAEESITSEIYTVDNDRTTNILEPRPAVNPPMLHVGDAISLNTDNSKYLMSDNKEHDAEDL